MVITITWLWPTKYPTLSGYDWKDPVDYISSLGTKNHAGIDIRAPQGTPIFAPIGSTVKYAGLGTSENNQNSGYGNLVILETPSGYDLYFAHLSSMSVSAGETIKAGQTIGKSGNTGNSQGAHLHFEVRTSGGKPVNPWDFFGGEDTPKEIPGDGDSGDVIFVPGKEPKKGETKPDETVNVEPVGFMEYQYTLDLGVLGSPTFTVNWGNVVAVLIGIVLIFIGAYGLVQVAGKTAVKELASNVPLGEAVVESVA